MKPKILKIVKFKKDSLVATEKTFSLLIELIFPNHEDCDTESCSCEHYCCSCLDTDCHTAGSEGCGDVG